MHWHILTFLQRILVFACGDQRPIFNNDVPADEMQDGEDQLQPVYEARVDTEEAEPAVLSP